MKFTKEDILADQIMKDFLNNCNINDNTKVQYEIRIRSYCNFTKKTPTKLVDEATEEQNTSINLSNRKVRKYLLDFFDKLILNGKSENTIKAHLETITALYHANNIDIQNMGDIFKKEFKPQILEELPTKEHIRKALKYCNLRDKAIILLQFSSGMSAAVVRNLTYGQILHGNQGIYQST
jgi:integrase